MHRRRLQLIGALVGNQQADLDGVGQAHVDLAGVALDEAQVAAANRGIHGRIGDVRGFGHEGGIALVGGALTMGAAWAGLGLWVLPTGLAATVALAVGVAIRSSVQGALAVAYAFAVTLLSCPIPWFGD